MKQIEERNSYPIRHIECQLTIREKLKLLFHKSLIIQIDFDTDSSDGVLKSEYIPCIK